MKRSWITSAVAGLALSVATFVGAPATASAAPAAVTAIAHVVTTFSPGVGGAFAESMTADGQGGLLVSLTEWGIEQPDGSWTDNYGQLYRVRMNGTRTTYGPRLDLGACSQLMGVTLDAGRVFVVVGNFDPSCGPSSLPSGVLRVTGSSATRVLTLPSGVFANGIAVVRGVLYVTDSASGLVWSGPAGHASAPVQPWFSSTKLAPTEWISIGADGIAYRDGDLYVAGYAKGYVVSVSIDHSGRPGKVQVVAHDTRLVRADGISFDPMGRLWITTNPVVDFATMTQTGDGALVMIDRGGHVRTIPTPAGSLDYPTQPVMLADGMYVANGSFVHGTPSVVRFTHLG